MKRKNVILVMVVILVPIIILGALAMSGAERFHDEKEAGEGGEIGGEETAASAPLVDGAAVLSSPYLFSEVAQPLGI